MPIDVSILVLLDHALRKRRPAGMAEAAEGLRRNVSILTCSPGSRLFGDDPDQLAPRGGIPIRFDPCSPWITLFGVSF